MTIYPAAWPSIIGIKTRRFTPDFNQAVFPGQFSRREQVQQHGGGKSDRWVGLWATPILPPAKVAEAEAFLASLKGLEGTFYAYDPDRRSPALGDPGVVTVDGAAQVGNTLAVDTPSASTQLFTAGDYFQLGVGLHMLTANGITDVSGKVILEFEPTMRVSPADLDVLTFMNPVMVARLDRPYDGTQTGADKTGVVSFSFHEVVA